MTTGMQKQFDDITLAALCEEHQHDLRVESVRLAGGAVMETPEMTWVSAEGWTGWRWVARVRLDSATADAWIAEVGDRIRAGEVPGFWCMGPMVRPADLEDRLVRGGFVRAFEGVGMAVRYEELREDQPWPEGLEIRELEAGDEAIFEKWARAVALWLFAMTEGDVPQMVEQLGVMWSTGRIECYAGLVKGEVVATSALYVSRGAPGVYYVAVSPEHRRMGIGGQMTLAVLRAGRETGCPVAILQASAMGMPLYERLGFKEYCRLGRYNFQG